jgi:hypothetical protein
MQQPRWAHPKWAHPHRSVLSLVVLPAVLACATGNGSPIPRGSPRLAPGSTPEPLRYEVVVAGRRPVVRSRVARLLTDSMFHVTSADLVGAVTAYSLARLTKIRVELVPAGKDSIRVALTGETYIGDTTRRDSISGLPERWRLITASDPTALVLRGLARALRVWRGGRQAAGSSESPGSTAGASTAGTASLGGTPGPGGTRPETDPGVTALLATTPVGRSADVCRDVQVPAGWLVLFWYRDPARCAGLADQEYAGEPNLMRIEREW